MSDAKPLSIPAVSKSSKFESRSLFNSATVALHTTQAQVIWNGKASAPNKVGIRPPGAVSVPLVSGALRYVYMETGADNPWADFALLRFQDALSALLTVCEERTQFVRELLARQAAVGVVTQLMARASPNIFELVLYTPYHGLLLEALAIWDATLRHVLTLDAAGKLDYRKSRDLIDGLRNLLASALEGIVRDAGHVRRASVPITRALLCNEPTDDASIAAAKAAKSASATLAKKFGTELPANVLSGERRPEHRRPLQRTRLTVAK